MDHSATEGLYLRDSFAIASTLYRRFYCDFFSISFFSSIFAKRKLRETIASDKRAVFERRLEIVEKRDARPKNRRASVAFPPLDPELFNGPKTRRGLYKNCTHRDCRGPESTNRRERRRESREQTGVKEKDGTYNIYPTISLIGTRRHLSRFLFFFGRFLSSLCKQLQVR